MNKINEMLEVAKKSMKNSNLEEGKAIGAAALGSSGKIYSGTTLISIPEDFCAERVALLKAISEGEKKIESVLITWKTNEIKNYIKGPCGICLNALWQLSNNKELKIILFPDSSKNPIIKKIKEFYPYPYSQNLK